MNLLRNSHVRRILVAAVAAFCLVTFGALPHASAGLAAPAGASGSTLAASKHGSEVITRTQAAFGVAGMAALPAAELGSSGVIPLCQQCGEEPPSQEYLHARQF